MFIPLVRLHKNVCLGFASFWLVALAITRSKYFCLVLPDANMLLGFNVLSSDVCVCEVGGVRGRGEKE